MTSGAFAPDSRVLASAGIGDEVFLWSVPDGGRIETLGGHETAVGGLQFSPDGKHLWSLGYEAVLNVRYVDGWALERKSGVIPSKPFAFALSPNASLVGITLDHGVAVLSANTFQALATEKTLVKGMYGVTFSPNASPMATAAFGTWRDSAYSLESTTRASAISPSRSVSTSSPGGAEENSCTILSPLEKVRTETPAPLAPMP